MNSPFSSLTRTALCSALLVAGASQPLAIQGGRVAPTSTLAREGLATTPVRPARHAAFDLRTRRVTPLPRTPRAAAPVYCYVSTDGPTAATLVDDGETLIDWDVMGGSAGTQCLGLSSIVTGFDFSYATGVPDASLGGPGASLTLTFYTGYQGFGQDSGRCPVATFAFSGLPGDSGSGSALSTHTISVDTTGGAEFCLPDGNFALGYATGDEGLGGTGPVLALVEAGPYGGLDIWRPDTKGVASTILSLCQAGPCFGFAFRIARADLSGTPAQLVPRNGGGTNKPGSLAASSAALGTTMDLSLLGQPGHLQGLFFAFDTPGAFPLAGGQVLLCADGGSGELLGGAGLAGVPAGTVGGCPSWQASLPLPKNLDFCGYSFCLQGLTAFGVTPFALSSALDVTLGG